MEGTEGIVYIAGAGCGNVITEAARKLIEEVDVIVHDELFGRKVWELLDRSKAEKINAGKRAGRHRMRQEEINELLVSLAKEGKKVLRLKAGDPFIFGRGGEEMEYLAENGVKFVVVPGISSAIAAPACAGIPLTHRKFDPAVVFFQQFNHFFRLRQSKLASPRLSGWNLQRESVNPRRRIHSR